MTAQYRCKHFDIREWVPPEVYELRGDKAWELLDSRILMAADRLRDRLDCPVIINTWHSRKLIRAYGIRTQSGLRTLDYFIEVVGGDRKRGLEYYAASFSQHKYGRAFDGKLGGGITAEMAREIIKEEYEELGITAIEDGTSWLHGDHRNCDSLKVFIQ